MGNDTSPSKQRSNLSILVTTIIVIFLGITAFQIYLNTPETRPQVACYNLAVLHELVWLDPVEVFAPNDLILQVEHSDDVYATYRSCIQILDRQGWLKAF